MKVFFNKKKAHVLVIFLLLLTTILPNVTSLVHADTSSKKFLLQGGSEWKYVDDGTDLGINWRKSDFNDDRWKVGNAPLGYPLKETRPTFGSIETMVDFGGDEKDKHATTYFRTTFEIEDLADLHNTGIINAGIDDGAVIYLNGNEIARYNLPEGEIPFNGYGQDYGFDYAEEGVLQTFTLKEQELAHLVEGTNVLAIEVHQDRPSSSDLYWDMEFYTMDTEPQDESVYKASYISFGPGKDESSYHFSWYADRTKEAAVIEFAKKARMDGEQFPANAATSVTAAVSNASSNFSTQKAEITGVEADTEYVYRLGDGNDKWTETYTFKTESTDAFNFLFMGDPQIGSGTIPSDTEGWTNTVNKAYEKFPNTSFMLSAGDQVNKSSSETEYAGYFAPDLLKSIPTATTVGNHDNSLHYKYHFNVPNESEKGSTAAGGNYYFTHGDTAFMVLNTNSREMDEHIAFLEETVEKTNKKWNFVMLHHSIYSAASHSLEDGIIKLRNDLVPTFDKLNIDTVFMGHDHVYVRTHQMKADQPLKAQVTNEDGHVINPDGTLYLTGNSASGSKYYNLKPDHEPYAAVREQLRVPTFSNIEVTDNRFTVNTYRVDTMEKVDTYTFIKDDDIEIEKPKLASVTIDANETEMSLVPSAFYPNVNIKLSGENEKGGAFDVPYDRITYKTDQADQLIITNRGNVTLAENAQAGKVTLWAEVELDGETYLSNEITIQILNHEEITLLEQNSMWKYLDDGSDQATAWRTTPFDDKTWMQGDGPLGYSKSEKRPKFGTVNTLLDYGPDSKNKHATYYFRTTFDIEDIEEIGDKGYVNFGIDDSVVLYLNGEEIGRFNLPDGEIPYDAYSAEFEGSSLADEDRYETFLLTEKDLAHLVEGTNVLAAEVHQDRPSSSDIYWDMEMITTKQVEEDSPEVPEEPETPEQPENPDVPEEPETPEQPENPDGSEELETPEKPGELEKPDGKEESKTSETTSPKGSSKEGKKLPATATTYFNWLVSGLSLLLLGSITMVIRRRSNQVSK